MMEWNSYYSNACYECGNWGIGYPLTICKGCRAVSFCEKDLINPKHQQLCQVLTELRGNKPHLLMPQNENKLTQETWTSIKSNIMLIAQFKLGRKLDKQEEEIFKFPRKCVSCFECNPDDLEDCKICPSTSFCKQHIQDKEHHAERCKKLLECVSSDVFFCPMLKRDMPAARLDYSNMKLPNNMEEFFDDCGPDIMPFPHRVQASANAEIYTRPLTLLYAMEKLNFDKNKKLIVHVVGANLAELEDPSAFELLFHYRPHITELKIIFIGPELPTEIPEYWTLCDSCNHHQVKFELTMVPLFYHDYVNKDNYIKPDIVVGYNLGIHECLVFDSASDTWPSSIKVIADQSCPFICTGYTQDEAQQDHERIIKSTGKLLPFVFEKNPFSSLRHFRDFVTEDFFYQNQYLLIYKNNTLEDLVSIGNLKITDDDSMVCN